MMHIIVLTDITTDVGKVETHYVGEFASEDAALEALVEAGFTQRTELSPERVYERITPRFLQVATVQITSQVLVTKRLLTSRLLL